MSSSRQNADEHADKLEQREDAYGDDVMELDGADDKLQRYRFIWRDVRRRWCKPWADPIFIIYFFLAIVICGGLGFWIELYRYVRADAEQHTLDGLRTVLFTLFPALIGTTALDSVWAEGGNEGRAFAMLGFVLAILLAVAVGADPSIDPRIAVTIGLIAWIATMLVWWIANADNPNLGRREPSPMAAIGGADPKASLPGNLDEFEH